MGAGKGKAGAAGGKGGKAGGGGGGFPEDNTVQTLVSQYESETGDTIKDGTVRGSLGKLFPRVSTKELHDKLVPYVYEKYGEAGVKRMVEQAYKENRNISFIQEDKAKFGKAHSPLNFVAMEMWTGGKSPNGNMSCTTIRHLQQAQARGEKIDAKNGHQIMDKIYSDTLTKYVNQNGTTFQDPIYRGFTNNHSSWKPKIGDTWSQRGAASWTSDRSVAKDFLSNAGTGGTGEKYIMIAKNAKGADIDHISRYPGEKEVLVNNRNYKITDIKPVYSYDGKKLRYTEVYVE